MGCATEARGEKSAAELLKEFQATGLQKPFEEIVRRYAGMVFHVCLKVTKNSHDAEDATQAVFLTLAVQAKTAREIRYIGPWLQQVAHRVALDMRKSKNRRQLREEQHGELARLRGDEATNGNGAHALDVQELNGMVGEELNKLPAKYRLPLILHYYGGLSREAMAKELNCKPTTLGVRLHRGREMLGTRLAERGVVLAEGALAVGLVAYIHSSVTESMVAATCHAASSLVAGRDLHAGLVSAQVVGMAKNAVRAVLLAKLKLAAAVVLAAGTALAAGAEVVAKIHPLDLRWNLNMSRLLRPLLEPLFRPSYSQTPVAPASSDGKLTLGDQPVLSPVAGGAWSSWSTGAVEGTAPVFIPQAVAAKEAAPPAVASRSVVMGFGPLDGQQQSSLSGGSRMTSAAAGTSTIVLTGPPIPGSNKSPAIDRSASSLTMTVPPPPPATHSRDTAVSFQAASAPRYLQPLVYPTLVPLAGNVPIGPYPATASINLPPPPQPNNPGHPSTAVLNSTSALAGGAASANRTIYLNQVAPPAPAGPTSPGATMLSVASDTTTNARQPRTMVVNYDAPVVTAYTNSATAISQSQPVATSVYQPRMLAQISGATLAASSDTLQGWGVVGPADTFDQNGRVIADGQGTPHTLDLSQVASVRNSVDNPTTSGANGWFAQNGGKLLWPPMQVAAGAGSYTSGEDPADPGLDLVNSVRLNVKNASKPAMVSVALLSTDRPDYPPLPTADHVLDIWQIDSTDPALGRMGVIVRYDDAAVSKLGVSESRLKLWQFNNGWGQVQDSFALDTGRKTIGGDADSPSFLALAGPDVGSTDMPLALSSDTVAPSSASALLASVPQTMVVVPEPAGLLTLATAAAYLLSRRRRPQCRRS